MSETNLQKIERLERLRNEASSLEQEITSTQQRCFHSFGEVIYDPIKTPNMVYDHLEPHGSDPEPIYVQSGWNYKPRWKRVCKNCGKVEYTEKTAVVKTAPDFGV